METVLHRFGMRFGRSSLKRLKAGLSDDEVHPNHAGYQIMEPIILSVLQ